MFTRLVVALAVVYSVALLMVYLVNDGRRITRSVQRWWREFTDTGWGV